MSTAIPSVSQLQRAIKIAEQIQALEAELAGILGRTAPAATAAGRKAPAEGKKAKRKYNFSPEARAKIAAAQKARWAKQKKAAVEGASPKAKK